MRDCIRIRGNQHTSELPSIKDRGLQAGRYFGYGPENKHDLTDVYINDISVNIRQTLFDSLEIRISYFAIFRKRSIIIDIRNTLLLGQYRKPSY